MAICGLKPGERSSRTHFVKVHPRPSWPHRVRQKHVKLFQKQNVKLKAKVLPKSLKHLAKIVQNRSQNDAKSRSGWGLGGSWAALGRLLSGSWLPGPSAPPLGRFLGSSRAVLEPSWAPIGRLLGLCWARTGASWGSFGDVLGHPRVSWRALGASRARFP